MFVIFTLTPAQRHYVLLPVTYEDICEKLNKNTLKKKIKF